MNKDSNNINALTYHIFFRNLANPLKIRIILKLKEKNMNVGELSRELEVEQSKVSHALMLLKRCNIVNFNKKGKERIYSLNKNTITPIFKIIEEHSRTFCKNKECKRCGK